jgi:GT2 family glycosyltransferase
VKTRLFLSHGLLSEKFFFGEEDIEFCLRLRKLGLKLACLYEAIIYHKVSTSTGGSSVVNYGKIYIHLLSRFINMRDYLSPPVWHIWRLFSLVYIAPMLACRYRLKFITIFRMLTRLMIKSSSEVCVTRKDFFDALTTDKY